MTEKNGEIMLHYPTDRVGENALFADVGSLRDELEAVGSPNDALAFLRRSGPILSDGNTDWSEFREWQAYFRNQRLAYDPAAALPGFWIYGGLVSITDPSMNLRAEWKSHGRTIFAVMNCTYAFEAIAALNQVDRINRVRTLECRNCGRPFEQTDKRKIYCEHRCADAFNRKRRSKVL